MSGYQPRSFSHTVLVQVNFTRCTGSGGGGRGTVTDAYAAFLATERRDANFFTEIFEALRLAIRKTGGVFEVRFKGRFHTPYLPCNVVQVRVSCV